MKYFLLLLVFVMTASMGGCSHVMTDVGMAGVDPSITYADIKKNPEVYAGKKVLVGGIIAVTVSSGDVTQIEVTQLELFSNGVPDETSTSAGRFFVVSGELIDPLQYRPGLLVTVIGEIKGQKVQKLEGADYRYPVFSAKEIRLFRTSDLSIGRRTNPYQSEPGDGRSTLRPLGGLH